MSWAARLFKAAFVTATLSLWPLIFVFTFDKSYFVKLPQTIFAYDYQARQQVLRNTYAYPNIPLARLFQNKAMIPISKFEHNLTALLDPNNYFFGFHPREIVSGNQNAVKFPFVALPVFLLGLFHLALHPPGERGSHLAGVGIKAVILFVVLVICLSFLANFDHFDFILYFPLAVIFFSGLKKVPSIYFFISLPFVLIEVTRQIIIVFPK